MTDIYSEVAAGHGWCTERIRTFGLPLSREMFYPLNAPGAGNSSGVTYAHPRTVTVSATGKAAVIVKRATLIDYYKDKPVLVADGHSQGGWYILLGLLIIGVCGGGVFIMFWAMASLVS